jgi:hypothetical protein
MNKVSPRGTMNIALTAFKTSHLRCVHCGKNGHEAKTCRIQWENIKGQHEQNEEKFKSHKPAQLVISRCNIGINEGLFKTSFSS